MNAAGEKITGKEPDVALTVLPKHRRNVRFTSNIVGPLLFIRDLLCLLVSVPLALLAYDLMVGLQFDASVHVFAVGTMIACFFVIRSSKQAYERSLISYLDQAEDSLMDAIISGLVATALVFLMGKELSSPLLSRTSLLRAKEASSYSARQQL